MDKSLDKPASNGVLIERELDRELAEVQAAIALVRSGATAEVSVANLLYGEQVLEQIRGRGADTGVRLDAIPWPEDTGCDLRIRRADG